MTEPRLPGYSSWNLACRVLNRQMQSVMKKLVSQCVLDDIIQLLSCDQPARNPELPGRPCRPSPPAHWWRWWPLTLCCTSVCEAVRLSNHGLSLECRQAYAPLQ